MLNTLKTRIRKALGTFSKAALYRVIRSPAMKTLNSLTQFLRRWLVTARRSLTAPAAALLLFAATCGVTDASEAAGNSIHDTSTAASLGERAKTEAVENGVSEFISWTNFWAVQLADNPDYADNADGEIISSLQTANLLAAKHGLVNMGQVREVAIIQA